MFFPPLLQNDCKYAAAMPIIFNNGRRKRYQVIYRFKLQKCLRKKWRRRSAYREYCLKFKEMDAKGAGSSRGKAWSRAAKHAAPYTFSISISQGPVNEWNRV